MAEETKLQQQMLDQMQNLQKLQKQMEEIQRKNQLYQYKGPQLRVRIHVADKAFMSSTKVLCNKVNGNHLFMQQILGINDDENDNERKKENSNEGLKKESVKKPLIAESDGIVNVYFDRDPELFPLILNYLRGYTMDLKLYQCSVTQLQSLLNDAIFYNIKGFTDLIHDVIHKRFDPRYCSPLIELSSNGIVATRRSENDSLHHNCGVYSILRNGRRYVEFQIMSQGKYIMFGVTEADNYSFAPYPGRGNCRGCSYYAANGNCYRANSSEAWGAALSYGDKCGILVDINNEEGTATIAWYANGNLIKQARNLKDYMDVTKGVVFVVNLYAATEKVVIVQSPNIPQ